MPAQWSKATLLRRMESEFNEATGSVLINEFGVPSKESEGMSLADFAGYISRQIVVEQMTGRKAPARTVTPVTEDGEE